MPAHEKRYLDLLQPRRALMRCVFAAVCAALVHLFLATVITTDRGVLAAVHLFVLLVNVAPTLVVAWWLRRAHHNLAPLRPAERGDPGRVPAVSETPQGAADSSAPAPTQSASLVFASWFTPIRNWFAPYQATLEAWRGSAKATGRSAAGTRLLRFWWGCHVAWQPLFWLAYAALALPAAEGPDGEARAAHLAGIAVQCACVVAVLSRVSLALVVGRITDWQESAASRAGITPTADSGSTA